VILRIEDLDAGRVRDGAAEGAMADLQWLGLDWDEGPDLGGPSSPYVQSKRMVGYQTLLDRLKSLGLVYPCSCTRADIERAASAPHPEDEGPTYPGTCSNRSANDADNLGHHSFAWRFRVNDREVRWLDLFQGERTIDPRRLGGDFVVARSGVGPSYQLAVVHDDATMSVNQVIRGDDLVPSTPRQILLYQALGWEPPSFGHVPLAVGTDGRRLAKRDGSLKLATLRERGVDPARIIGSIAQTCGWSDRIEPKPPDGWIDRFDFGSIPKNPWIITPEVLAELAG
jgi:glutamyl-tRNA synthetase